MHATTRSRDVADGREQRRIHHRSSHAKQRACKKPCPEAVHEYHRDKGNTLSEHPACYEPLATEPLTEGARAELDDAPRGGVDEREHTDLSKRNTAGREE